MRAHSPMEDWRGIPTSYHAPPPDPFGYPPNWYPDSNVASSHEDALAVGNGSSFPLGAPPVPPENELTWYSGPAGTHGIHRANGISLEVDRVHRQPASGSRPLYGSVGTTASGLPIHDQKEAEAFAELGRKAPQPRDVVCPINVVDDPHTINSSAQDGRNETMMDGSFELRDAWAGGSLYAEARVANDVKANYSNKFQRGPRHTPRGMSGRSVGGHSPREFAPHQGSARMPSTKSPMVHVDLESLSSHGSWQPNQNSLVPPEIMWAK